MRVKSRKPLAACAKSAAASGRAASSATSANASRCGRCETAAKMRSCARGVELDDVRAAGLPQRAHARDRVARRSRRSGVRIDVAVVEQRRRTPPRRRSARCRRSDAPGTNAASASPNAARAAAITSCFVLPASVTTVARPSVPASAANSAANCATGVATQHDVGVAQLGASSRSSSVIARSMMPRASAVVEIGARAADADDLARPRPRACSASATRAADQADADDDELAIARGCKRSAAPSALRERRRGSACSPSGRPTVMRSHSGRP